MKKKIVFITILILTLLMIGCSNRQHISSFVDEKSENSVTDNHYDKTITKEQRNKLFSTMLSRSHATDIGTYQNNLDIFSNSKMHKFTAEFQFSEYALPDEKVLEYFETILRCENKLNYVVIFNSGDDGKPDDCVGFFCYSNIHKFSDIKKAKTVGDIYSIENPSNETCFQDYFDVIESKKNTERWSGLKPNSLHCTDEGLYIVEYDPDNFVKDDSKGNSQLNKNCVVKRMYKCEDNAFNQSYELVLKRLQE